MGSCVNFGMGKGDPWVNVCMAKRDIINMLAVSNVINAQSSDRHFHANVNNKIFSRVFFRIDAGVLLLHWHTQVHKNIL